MLNRLLPDDSLRVANTLVSAFAMASLLLVVSIQVVQWTIMNNSGLSPSDVASEMNTIYQLWLVLWWVVCVLFAALLIWSVLPIPEENWPLRGGEERGS